MITFLEFPEEVRRLICEAIEPTITIKDANTVVLPSGNHIAAKVAAQERLQLALTCKQMRDEMAHPPTSEKLEDTMIRSSMIWFNCMAGSDWKNLLQRNDHFHWYRDISHFRLPKHILGSLRPGDVGFVDRIYGILRVLGFKTRLDFVPTYHDNYWNLFHGSSILIHLLTKYPGMLKGVSMNNTDNIKAMEEDLEESIKIPFGASSGQVTVNLYRDRKQAQLSSKQPDGH
ncbi:hypothetical protein MMC10_002846 [Thelotrema lepadinum]|nr:hypothetical protein [Thelotrema lepadinum]